MSTTAAPMQEIGDTELALHLFVRWPAIFSGIVLRGDSPARDEMVAFAKEAIANIRKIPANVDSERLLGGLDLSETLAAGRRVTRPGLLEEAKGGAVLLPMAERIDAGIAAHIAQAIDAGDVAAILLDDSTDPDEAPPAVLTERVAFHCDVWDLRGLVSGVWPKAKGLMKVKPLTDKQLRSIAITALALGIASARALIFTQSAARAHAALHGRKQPGGEDIAAAVRLVLAPRATQVPQREALPEPESGTPDAGDNRDQGDERKLDNFDLDDIMLEAAAAAIPKHILDSISDGKRGCTGQAGRAGQKQKSALRGRPLSARAGVPGHGKGLALVDTLSAAAPWQNIRRRDAPPDDTRKIHIRKSDLRVRHYEQRAESLTIFAVDASGSSALSRLAEAKGAVELMLAEVYVKRSQVALIAFRQTAAEILLPPTRSLTRARRALAALPGGGGTPLAAGLLAAQHLANAASKRGQTPAIALLTDGKGNIAIDGSTNREAAKVEAKAAAKALAAGGHNSIVIDISPRPRAEAAELAEALSGRYLPLPQAHSAAMVAAIESL